jgi:hypothetical protein
MLFKNSVRTSKRTPHFTITKINWLTLFKEIIAVYIQNHAEPINTKLSGWYIYLPSGFKGQGFPPISVISYYHDYRNKINLQTRAEKLLYTAPLQDYRSTPLKTA